MAGLGLRAEQGDIQIGERTIRVLLADDTTEMRDLVRVMLELDGRFEVVGDAGDGVMALELVERQQPDVLLLDISMPRMDGLQVLAELQARGSDVKVLAFSAFNGSIESEASRLGAHGFLRKGDAAIRELIPALISLV